MIESSLQCHTKQDGSATTFRIHFSLLPRFFNRITTILFRLSEKVWTELEIRQSDASLRFRRLTTTHHQSERMATTAKRRMTLPFDIGDFANDKPALELITLIHEYARKLIVEHGVNRFESRRKPAELDLSYEDVNQLGAECFQHGKEYLTELLREINLQCIENLRVSLELEMRLAKDYIAHIRPSEHPVYTQNCGGDNGYSTGQPILDVVDGGDYESFLSIVCQLLAFTCSSSFGL